MTRSRWIALAVISLTPALALAGAEDTAPPVRVHVQPGEGTTSMGFVITPGDGSAGHALKMESRDGRVIIDAEPDSDRAWLGVLIERNEDGFVVTSVAKDSPAERAGLRAGDVITAADGRELSEGRGLLEGTRPGERVRFDVKRDDDVVRLDARLTGHPGRVEFDQPAGFGAFEWAQTWPSGLESLKGLEALQGLEALERMPCAPLAGKDCAGFFYQFGGGPKLGVVVEPLSEQLARYFGTDPGKGLLVKEVVEGSAAEKAGVLAGDVVLRVAGRDIRGAGDIGAALEGRKAGDTVDVEVVRRGEARTLDVTIAETPRQQGLRMPFVPHADVERALAEAGEGLARVDFSAVQRSLEEVAARQAEARTSGAPSRREVEAAVDAARRAVREAEQALARQERAN